MSDKQTAAPKTEMDALHDDLARKLRTLIEEGETGMRAGEPVKRPVSAAVLAVARGFLKDNHIECDKGLPTRPVGELAKSVQELNDDDDEIPEFPN